MPIKLTPMQQKYQQVKEQLPANTLLLIRLGDFYEAFGDDAVIVSRVLQIALTKRVELPMAGVPCWCLDQWTQQLISAGHKVATLEGDKLTHC